MKSSLYNVIAEDENKLIIYNTRTGNHLVLVGDSAHYAKRIFADSSISEENDLCAYLYANGFLIDSAEDELELVKAKRDIYINDNGLFLMILPTEQCNFRCVYCYERFSNPMMSHLTVSKIKEFVSENLSLHDKLTVAWFGGEPMLAMDIIDDLSHFFIKMCKKQRKPYFSMMTTNGSLLTPENWQRLKSDHITGYQITVDGLENTHDLQRISVAGAPTWKTIISNLQYFRDKIYTSTINIALRTNITKEIFQNYNEYLLFLKNEFGNDHRFHFFFHLAQDWGNLDGKDVKKSFCGTDEFYAVLNAAGKLGLPLSIHEYFIHPGARVCFAAKKNAYVFGSDGMVRKCSEHLYEDFNRLYDINHPEERFESNEKFWNCATRGIPDECQSCIKLPLCYGLVCPAYRGDIKDTCGYDLSDMEKTIKAIYGYGG